MEDKELLKQNIDIHLIGVSTLKGLSEYAQRLLIAIIEHQEIHVNLSQENKEKLSSLIKIIIDVTDINKNDTPKYHELIEHLLSCFKNCNIEGIESNSKNNEELTFLKVKLINLIQRDEFISVTSINTVEKLSQNRKILLAIIKDFKQSNSKISAARKNDCDKLVNIILNNQNYNNNDKKLREMVYSYFVQMHTGWWIFKTGNSRLIRVIKNVTEEYFTETENNNLNKVPLSTLKSSSGINQAPEIREIPHSTIQKEQQIGWGSYGYVYKGRLYQNTLVAIKEFPGIKNTNSKAWDHFQQETKILAKLDSPYVVKLHGICTQDKPYTLIMEYVELGSLTGVLTKRNHQGTDWLYQLNWPQERGQIPLEIIYGMEYLHQNNIIHRDLKSDNILIFRDSYGFHAKLADFGTSKEKLCNTSTIREKLIGTYEYIAPELLKNPKTPTSQRTDMYSYGIVLAEIASREVPPFEAEKNEIINKNARPEVPKDCPPQVAELMSRCWDKNPEKRPSAHEVAKLLSA